MNPDSEFIPISRPYLGGAEEEYVVDAIRSTWISSSGKYVERFERDFATLCESGHSISVSNGTAALHLALAGLGVTAGDEVIVPSLTYVATANAVRYQGAEPVFADVDPQTWCIDPERIEALITRKTRGIIAVHLYGHPADMDAINAIATRHNLWVVEDAAEAHCARYKGRAVGHLAKLATFSFYGNKTITSGEGGAITLDDPELAARLRMLRGQGVDPTRRYYFPVIGYNYRLTNVACALLCAQLESAPEILRRRREIYEGYRRRLGQVPGIGFQPVANWAELSPWLFCLTIDPEIFGQTRDELADHLKQRQIETRPFFIPVHSLPPYEKNHAMRDGRLVETDRLAARGISLPTFVGLTDAQLDRICEAISMAARRKPAARATFKT